MKIVSVILFLLLFAAYANTYNFKCLSRKGWSPGYGRYNSEGEWIGYFKVYAKKGEYVLFYYPKGSHGY